MKIELSTNELYDLIFMARQYRLYVMLENEEPMPFVQLLIDKLSKIAIEAEELKIRVE